jgi:tRNA(fMet)-specific endonuclease VapC
LLDTSVIAEFQRGNRIVFNWFADKQSECVTSAIVATEMKVSEMLFYDKKQAIEANRLLFRKIRVLAFDRKASEAAGIIAGQLRQKIGLYPSYDMLIAGHAISRNLSLVTRNTKDFQIIDRLKLISL